MARDELDQEILEFGLLRRIAKGVVGHGFGAAHVIDANHERSKVLKRVDGLVRHDDETH
jgi:hypothetical protein